MTDPDGFKTSTEYDGEGNKVKLTDGNNGVRVWVRDAQGRVIYATDAEGHTTASGYDLNDNLVSVKEPNGTLSETDYDREDKPAHTTETASDGVKRQKGILSRDKNGNPLRVRDYLGNITVTEYNALNLPHSVYDPAPFNTLHTDTSYFKTGKVRSVTNRRGHTTSHEYDALNREIKVTDPLGQEIETAYDRVGNVKTVKDKRGIVKENFYDSLYRLERVVKDGLRLVTNEYDANGNLTAAIDANNNRIEHTYNKRNLRETTKYPATAAFPGGTMESRTYDGVGNLLTLTDEENKVTTYAYDRENRQTSSEFAGEKTVKTYDAVGNLSSVTKPLGNRKTMTYDGFRRLTSVVEDPNGLNLATRYWYDVNNNLVNRYDARNNRTQFDYDSLNRKIREIRWKNTGNLVTRYTYDEEGNLAETTDPKGQLFTFAYDKLNRQTAANYLGSSTPFNTINRIETGYDANNNVTSVAEYKTGEDNASIVDSTINEYDNFDRLTASAQRGMAISYTYDGNGNRTSVATPAGSTAYTFDGRNRIETAVADGLATSYSYYADGKKNTISYPNGTSVGYTYHPTNRVKTVANMSGEAVLSHYSYFYDKNGNRLWQTEVQNGATEVTSYAYDRVDRLISFTVTGAGEPRTTDYTYEGYNRKTEKLTRNGAVEKNQAYSYDETDWLKRIDDGAKTVTYEYDDNGNTIRKVDNSSPNQDITFAYDGKNQLIETKRGIPGSETILGRYDYNAQGLRVRHRLSDRGDVDYFYDGRSVIEEHNAQDDTLLAHYRYADRLVSLDTGIGKQYYHYDALGSTVNLTDDSGLTPVSYQLDPWGHIRNQFGSSLNRHIFTGKEHDENTGLIYFGARYYDPDTARFITQDPYLGEQGTPPSLHRYLYAYSNPTIYVDLFGYENVDAFGYPELKPMSVTARFLFPAHEGAVKGVSQKEQDDLNKYSIETSPKKIAAIGGFEAAVALLPLAPILAEGATSAYLTIEASPVVKTIVTGLSALHTYKMATDQDYRGETASLGPAALLEPVNYLAKNATTLITNTANKIGPLRSLVPQLKVSPNTLGMGGGNVEIKTGNSLQNTAESIKTVKAGDAGLIESGAGASESAALAGGGPQVLKNKAKGDSFRDEIAGLMSKEGFDVQTEVAKKTIFGKRVIDIEVSKEGKILGGIETKSGKSPYTPRQRAKDQWLKQFEDYIVNVVRDE